MSSEQDLLKFCMHLDFNDLNDTLVEHTKLVVMDLIGVIIGGFHFNPRYGKWAEEMMNLAPGSSTILGVGKKVEEGYAALANGTAGTSLEMDEGSKFNGGHPGIHVFPVALALSEKESRDGKEFITAVVAGYEIASRIGRAITPLREEIHPHGTWGGVGAAVAGAKLLRLKEDLAYQAASIASNYSLNAFFDTALEGATVRDSYSGVANFLGIQSVRLSQNGFTGLYRGISRQFAHLGQNGFQESCLVESLGQLFEIQRNYFKVHAGCRSSHGALDALNQIISSHGPVDLNKIVKIEVFTYHSAARLSNPNPKNALQARFSLPYAIAARLFYGSSSIDSYKNESIKEEVIRLAQRVTVSENPQFSSLVPTKRPTEVRLHFNNGQKESALIEIPEGDPARPYSPQILKEKFLSLISPSLGESKGKKILKKIEGLEEIKNLRELTSLLA
jgi:2-methylcitrate dehydratase PrpD